MPKRTKTLGQIAYEVHRDGYGKVTDRPWSGLSFLEQQDWEAAAQAVKRAVVREQRKRQLEADKYRIPGPYEMR